MKLTPEYFEHEYQIRFSEHYQGSPDEDMPAVFSDPEDPKKNHAAVKIRWE